MLREARNLHVLDDRRTGALEVVQGLLEERQHFRIRVVRRRQRPEHADPCTHETIATQAVHVVLFPARVRLACVGVGVGIGAHTLFNAWEHGRALSALAHDNYHTITHLAAEQLSGAVKWKKPAKIEAFFTALAYGPKLREWRRESREAAGVVTGFIGDTFGAILAVKTAGAEDARAYSRAEACSKRPA